MKDQVLLTIRTACSELFGIDIAEIIPVALFRDDLGLSVAELSLVFAAVLETHKLHVHKNEMKELIAGFITVGDMIEYVEDELLL